MSLIPEVTVERERCARLAEELASRWEKSAVKMRDEGKYWGGFLWKREFVRPNWEKGAKDIEAAADGLRTVARGIREGWNVPIR